MNPTQRYLRGLIYSAYQPIVEIHTGKIFGYEALTRRKGKERQPEALFFRAYQEGFVIDLDLICLQSAFRVLPQLKRRELLFVNIEPVTLSNASVKRNEMHSLLKRFYPYREQIVFELTEGMKPRDFLFIKKGVGNLRRGGSRFAIDDVAAVGPKLFQLLSLRPDFLKIDMSLVRGLAGSRIRQELINRLARLARHKGCHLIAEGVERKRELDLLCKLGIPYAQGFYFSRARKFPVASGRLRGTNRLS